MADSDNAIRLTEGDVLTYTITVKRAGAAVDLTAHFASGSVQLFAHDDNAAHGTNQINALDAADNVAASGIVDFAITITETTISGSDTDLTGWWAIKLVDTAATTVEWTKREDFFIFRNPFTV